MSIYKRNGVYWMDFVFDRKRYQASTKTKNLRAAEQIQAKAKTDLALGRYGLAIPKPVPLFKDFAETFKSWVKVRNAEHPATVAFYEEKLTRLLEYKPFSSAKLNEIDEAMIENYVALRRKTMAPGSVNKELATLRKLLRYASRKLKLIPTVPTFTKLKGEGEREFILTYDMEKLYLAVTSDTLRDFAILALDTGVRCGEAATLEWKSVNFEPAQSSRLGSIHILKGKSKNAKRILSMTPRVKAMLENRRKFFPKERYVFPGQKKGSHMRVSSFDNAHYRTWQRIVDDEGKPRFPEEFVIHSLRHTFGTRLGESGADAFTIMRVMGHSSVTVSQKYVHPTPDSLERTFERLDKMNQIMRGEQQAAEVLGVPTDSPNEGSRSKSQISGKS